MFQNFEALGSDQDKEGCIFSIVIWSDFRLGKYRDDHREEASRFNILEPQHYKKSKSTVYLIIQSKQIFHCDQKIVKFTIPSITGNSLVKCSIFTSEMIKIVDSEILENSNSYKLEKLGDGFILEPLGIMNTFVYHLYLFLF